MVRAEAAVGVGERIIIIIIIIVLKYFVKENLVW